MAGPDVKIRSMQFSNTASTVGSQNQMGLFPCLRHGSGRWWLPLSEISLSAIGNLLIFHNTDSPVLRRDLAEAIRLDPPLFLFAALQWPLRIASETDLVEWLIENVPGQFASGDAYLGTPEVTSETQQRFRKLRAHYKTLDRSDWMRDAPLWLEVLGDAVPLSWHQTWPTVEFEDTAADLNESALDLGSQFLQQLARQTQHHRALESSFDQQLHRNKLGALKQLAYGLSHEINNPLANISTRAQQLQRDEEDSSRHATLQRIVDQVYRAHEMISDLMFYANPPEPNPESCDLNGLVQTIAGDFDRIEETNSIRLEIQLSEQPAITRGDPAMLRHAVGSLIRNSIDAIGCGGTIIVSLSPSEDCQPNTVDGEKNGSTIRNHRSWRVHIADSGPGLSEIDRNHAFDPYYSGREAGRGLGLGLCRAYRIMKLHGGDIKLSGGPAGCVATLFLPAFSAR